MADEAVAYPYPTKSSCLEPTVPGLQSDVAFRANWDADIQRAARRGAALLRGDRPDVDDLAQEARFRATDAIRRMGLVPTRYMRRVIKNAVLNAVRRERRALTTRSRRCDDLPADLCAAPLDGEQGEANATVTNWVATLEPRLQRVYELLYDRGLTQRVAAEVLGVSQPRVAQLHRTLLRRGRQALAMLAA